MSKLLPVIQDDLKTACRDIAFDEKLPVRTVSGVQQAPVQVAAVQKVFDPRISGESMVKCC